MATRLYKLKGYNKYYYGTWQRLTILNNKKNDGWKYAIEYRKKYPIKNVFPKGRFFSINDENRVVNFVNVPDNFDANRYSSLAELVALEERKT